MTKILYHLVWKHYVKLSLGIDVFQADNPKLWNKKLENFVNPKVPYFYQVKQLCYVSSESIQTCQS